jgi:DNA-binding protein HU-beta
MNVTQLAAAVRNNLDCKPGLSKAAVSAVLGEIGIALLAGDDVHITGFGTFKLVDRATRTARNPQTGETVQVPAHKVPVFKPGQRLRDFADGTRPAPANAADVIAKAPKGSKG